jgi:hypothetical protein
LSRRRISSWESAAGGNASSESFSCVVSGKPKAPVQLGDISRS